MNIAQSGKWEEAPALVEDAGQSEGEDVLGRLGGRQPRLQYLIKT